MIIILFSYNYMDNKIEDAESSAQTLKPKATAFSQRPTIPILTNINKIRIPWYRRFMHLIIIILVLMLICEIIFIAHNAKSKNIPTPSVTYNIPAIIEPPEQTIIVTPVLSSDIPDPKPSSSVNQIKPIIKNIIKNKDKDYGI